MDAYLARFDRRLEQEFDPDLAPWPSVRWTCLRVIPLPPRIQGRLRCLGGGS